VFIHEGGHFLAARANGMRVTEFFLGLPCKWRLAKRSKKYGTAYGVTPLLLGGYTQVCGMDVSPQPHAAAVLACVNRAGRISAKDIASELALDEKDVLDALESLIDWASVEPYYNPELGEHPSQKYLPEAFQTVARDASGLTIYDRAHNLELPGATAAGEPCMQEFSSEEAYQKERNATYAGKGFWARFSVLVAGVVVNLAFGLVLIVVILSGLGVEVASNSNEVAAVGEGSLAEASGIAPGDRIIEINGVETGTWTEVATQLASVLASGEDFDVVTQRGDVTTEHAVEQNGESHAAFGVSATTEVMHLPITTALKTSWSYLTATASAIAMLFQPAHVGEVLENSTSVVGISVMASQAAQEGLSSFLSLGAAISLSLGFMNLLPIPPLDGGKIVIEAIGAVIRRPVPLRVQTIVSYVGIFLFLLLFFFMLRQDIVRFILPS
jgi:regulator of sigma E protease